MYEGATHVWRTPGGVSAVMAYRLDTNDADTIRAVFDDDEYRLPRGLTGLALDIGAHIGAVSVALALDNPDLRIMSVEPVRANLELLERNLRDNGIRLGVHVYPYAVAAPGVRSVDIRHNFRGTEVGAHHAFIGNAAIAPDAAYDVSPTKAFSLSGLLNGQRAAWMKVDIEGGEYGFLSDPAVALVDVIVGEHHPDAPDGTKHHRDEIVNLLGATHRVTFSGPVAGPGGFRATRH